MLRLLHRIPRHAVLWVPLLALPLVIGEIWLHLQGARRNPGLEVSLLAMTAILSWYLLSGGIALSRARDGILQRRQLSKLRPMLEVAGQPGWAVAGGGMVLAQSPEALDRWGDWKGRPLSQLLAGQFADAERETTRLIARALRHGRAERDLPDGVKLLFERSGTDLLRISMSSLVESASPSTADPMDYERLPIAILRLAPDGTILNVNSAATPFCGHDAVGAHVSRVLDGLGRPFDAWLHETLASPGTSIPEVLRAPHAGQDRFIQVSMHAEDHGSALIAVLSDARALKTLEAQFVQSQKMQAIGQLAGGIAHDFNNLLTAISGHCDLLMLRHDKGDPDFSDLDQISQNANRAANLVSHLLAFSRKQTLKPQRVDLRNTIADLSHLLNRLVGEKITLEQRHDPRLYPVRVDRGKFEQVVMNLVVNARDAMPQGGRIDIATQNIDLSQPQLHGRFAVPPGRYVRIDVTDQGCGMTADVLGKIFEPFFTTKRVGEGTGLGLSTAYGIVKQTGGYIMCESAPGQGTTFTIYLPAYFGADDTPPEEIADPVRSVSMTAPPDRRVLLVEDEAPVRAFASRALKLRGYQVIEAESGEEALELLTDDKLTVDLFVSDVVMPGMDGLSWVRRALRDRPGTRVIFMSGYTEDVFEDGRSSIEGASFLQKPFSLSDLVAAVGEKFDHAAELPALQTSEA
ncbi:response regulator [Paracoccus aurantiacus]|uniref:histidine kinase n=1 Tax=Paracoccus aurantiacus TaxID=2599412 RepID=A0A5C6S2G5_9RHOB|nr:ATP-binding protein [Paracoccus aurantiacus]TXB68604.1 response regulator [Paracoccus aurantiacus]